MPSESHHAFLCRNDAGSKNPGELGQLSGGKFYAPVFLTPMHRRYSISMRLGLTGRAFCCWGAGSWMCRMPSSNFAWISSFFTASHIEAAGAGAGEGLAADVAAVVVLLIVRVAAHSLNGQVAVVQIHLNVFLLAARQVNSHIVAVLGLLHIGLHHVCTALTEGLALFTVHRTLQRTIVPERIKEIIEQILMENSRHKT